MRLSVPYAWVAALAAEYGAIDCSWRESDRAFTGFVAEVWFEQPAGEFAQRWAKVIGYHIRSRQPADGPARYMLSIPVVLTPAPEI
ncbi:MAG: hypothetical protein RLZZ511_2351 [Cyanobacteriota bacterium]|jgi:hypothetical protein